MKIVLQIYTVLEMLENEWEKSRWIVEDVVIECILYESMKTIHNLMHTGFCFTDCVKSVDNVTSVLNNTCQQSEKNKTKKTNKKKTCNYTAG